jgi:hypothetical protein
MVSKVKQFSDRAAKFSIFLSQNEKQIVNRIFPTTVQHLVILYLNIWSTWEIFHGLE